MGNDDFLSAFNFLHFRESNTSGPNDQHAKIFLKKFSCSRRIVEYVCQGEPDCLGTSKLLKIGGETVYSCIEKHLCVFEAYQAFNSLKMYLK